MSKTNGYQQKQLIHLRDLFKKLFEDRVDDVLETRVHGKMSLYVLHHEDRDFLENFVKEYFIMRNKIESNTSSLIKTLVSDEYKKANLMYKIRIRLRLMHWQNLCERVNKFESQFFQKTNISLQGVEEDILYKEQVANREKISKV